MSSFSVPVYILLALLSPKVVLPPSLRFFFVGFLCCAVTYTCYVWVPAISGSAVIWDYDTMVGYVAFLIALPCVMRVIGWSVGDATFWWKICLVYVCLGMQALVGVMLFPMAQSMTDVQKTICVMIVIPLYCELMLTFQRLIVRSLSEHHESAAGFLLAPTLLNKSMAGRYMIALIQRPSLAFFSAMRIPMWNEDWRDRQIYKLLWRCSREKRHGNFHDPTRHPRNVSLRERVLQLEVIFNLSSTFTTGILILMLGISTDGRHAPDSGAMALNIMMQWLGICVTHLFDVLYSSAFLHRPFLAVANLNFRGYHLALAALSILGWGAFLAVHLPSLLARVPLLMTNNNGSEPTWLFLTEDVVAAMNSSAICAQFPSATAYAAFMGC